MAVTPKVALAYISEDLKSKIDKLEEVLDHEINCKYVGKTLEIKMNDFTTLKYDKDFYSEKVMVELRKRYVGWSIELNYRIGKDITLLKFNDPNHSPSVKDEPIISPQESSVPKSITSLDTGIQQLNEHIDIPVSNISTNNQILIKNPINNHKNNTKHLIDD